MRVERYTEGKENTLGIDVSETVYDKDGKLLRSYSYNTLSPSDKIYTESETDESGRTVADLDATGKHKTSYTYFADGSLASETAPNGSMLSYAYDKDGTQVSVTSSTTDGEGNTNVTHYTAGLVTRVESDNHVVDYVYDGKRRLTKVKLDGADYETYTYTENADGIETVTTSFANSENVVTKNAKGEITNFLLDCMSAFGYEYETDGRIKRRYDQYSGREYNCEYDGEKRLTSYTDSYGVEETIEYDGRGRLKEKTDKSNIIASNSAETTLSYEYFYDDERNRLSHMTAAGYTVTPTYDALGRSTGKKISVGTNVKASEEISYLKHGDHTTNLPAVMKFKTAQGEERIKYSYDAMGNIIKIAEDGIVASRYEYDTLGRLTREDNRAFGKTSLWEYDENGNILSRREYAFTVKTTEELTEIEPQVVVEYKYDGDRLIAYGDDTGFAYNRSKMPTMYRGKDISFVGSALHGYGDLWLSYDGNTLPRTIAGLTPSYDENGTITSDSFAHYIYSPEGALLGFVRKSDGAKYLYRRDALGNIIAILDTNGNIVVNYKYDAWGNHKILNASGVEITDTADIGYKNRFRYRGYYYSDDLGLYYLKSRFYDPEVGRFISADTVDYLAPESINGLNLYAYCKCNPIMYCDPSGHWRRITIPSPARAGAQLGALLGTIIAILANQTMKDIDTVKEIDSKIEFASDNTSFKLPDSYKVVTPWVQLGYSFYLNYIREDTKDIIGGTATGAQMEWLWHNLAFYALSVADWGLQAIGVTQFDDKIDKLKESAQGVDLQFNVFYNQGKIGKIMMFLNIVANPFVSAYELGQLVGRVVGKKINDFLNALF